MYLFIKNNKLKYSVNAMCRVLKVSESGYYRWLKNKDKPKAWQLLAVEINEILNAHPDNDNYGVKRMKTVLEHKGIKTSERTIYRAMKKCGLLHRSRKPHGITKADTKTQERENIIKMDFSADRPYTKLLTDITEVQCSDGKLYISAVLDCFNGEIVALEMRDNMKKDLCIDTIKQLKSICKKENKTILHSDRGCQYTSYTFREELAKCGLIQSLSGTGHCFDNSRMESFFATLKKEKLYRIPTYKMTREQVKTEVFRYIFGYYNTIRVNSFNPDGMPPVAYRKSMGEKLSAA